MLYAIIQYNERIIKYGVCTYHCVICATWDILTVPTTSVHLDLIRTVSVKMKDVNGGYWGLVIIFSAFMTQFVAFGIAMSIGIYNIELLAVNENAFAVSLVSAINNGVFLATGPLASLLMNYLSHRTITLIGAFLSSASVLCMPFLPSLEYMYAIYGVLGGLGFCLVYVPSHVMSALYYDTHQSVSTGVASAGLGLGMTLFPIIIGYLIEEYTWRPSFLVVSGISLNLFVFALLLRPLKKDSTKTRNVETGRMLKHGDDINVPETEVHKTPLRHFYVFCSFKFDVYFVSCFLWNMCLNTVVTFGPDFLTTRGLSVIDAAFVFTVFCLCTFVGSLLTGALGTRGVMMRHLLYILSCVTGGIAVLSLPLVTTYATIIITHMFTGLGFGGILGLLVAMTLDTLGPESVGDGLGYLLLSNGAGLFAGPPLAGYLKDTLGRYDEAFYTGGTLFVVSGILMVLIPVWDKYGQKKKTDTV